MPGGGASTGVAVCEQCITKFLDLKKSRKYKWLVFKIDTEGQKIVNMAEAPAETDEVKGYEAFNIELQKGNDGPDGKVPDCRYGVYDHSFTDKEGCQKSKIIFITWVPDDAKIKAKMMYAASKDTFRQQLDGVHLEMQATDVEEASFESMTEKATMF